MTSYTLRLNNLWFNIGSMLNIGTIFAINDPDGDPFSTEPPKDGIIHSLKKALYRSARQIKKPVDPTDTDSSTASAIDPDSQP